MFDQSNGKIGSCFKGTVTHKYFIFIELTIGYIAKISLVIRMIVIQK